MTTAEVEAFLADVPEPQQTTLRSVRDSLRRALPQAEETIYYGVPAFKVAGKGVAGYAAATRHCAYYPMSGWVLTQLAEELDGYDWGKGTLRFPVDVPLPDALVDRLVEVRLHEIEHGR